MIDAQSAIKLARKAIHGLAYVDPDKVEPPIFLSKASTMAADPELGVHMTDRWLVSFARANTGHLLDGIFDSLMVSVDAETGEATIREDL